MNQSVNLPLVDSQPRVRRSTYIANHFRDMIFTGALKPGDRLPTEEQLCKHFGVSRTTLRESVQMLRVSGLLDVTPGRGSFIRLPYPSILMKDLALLGQYSSMNTQDVSALRILFEVDMVRLACEASSEKKKILQSYIISRQGNAEEIEETERQWHLAIAEVAGNSLSLTMLDALLSMQRVERLKRFEDADEVMRTMGVQIRLNSAINEGDMTMATRVISAYLGSVPPQMQN